MPGAPPPPPGEAGQEVPAAARAALPVIVDGSGALLYVPGLRPSQAAAPSSDTRRTVALMLAGAESGD